MAQLAIRIRRSRRCWRVVVSDVSGVESLQQVCRLPAANLTHHDMIRAILRSIVRRRFKVTTRSQHRFAVAPNRLQRDFTAQRPNQVWVSDLTYLRVGRGWLYLVVFIDLYSRRVVGWALSSALDHRVALVALQRAVVHRRPPRGLIIHSDRGVQGGFKQSSQHLDYEELRWERRSEGAADRACRPPMQSPGRPPVWRREHKQRFWGAIGRGLSSEEAAAVASVSPAVGVRWFREGGGMSTVSTAPLSGRYLSFGEREDIAILHAQDCGVRKIARRLGRAPSTISRELRHNAATGGGNFRYRATTAQWHADRRAKRPKVGPKLAANGALRHYVQEHLAGTLKAPNGTDVPGPKTRWNGRRHGRRQDRKWSAAWSPEQISNRLPVDFPGDVSMRISHEAIYQALYVQGRGALRRELPVAGVGAGKGAQRQQPRHKAEIGVRFAGGVLLRLGSARESAVRILASGKE